MGRFPSLLPSADGPAGVFLLGHLGLTLLAARSLRPLLPAGEGVPVGFVLVGALLPDLVDKPLGHAILGWENGRLWGHALAFAAVLLAGALYAGSRRGLALGAATLVHQGLDQVWVDPTSWLWPLLGPFPVGVSGGVPDWWVALLSDPFLWSTEALGGLALLGLLVLPRLGLATRWWRASAPTAAEASGDAGHAGAADPAADVGRE